VTERPTDLLRRVPLFAELNDKELDRIAGLMKVRPVEAGRSILEEGKGGVGFFVIESGTANVVVGGKTVRTLGPGDHFGEIALIADTPRTATITAETDLRCHGITSWHFRPIVEGSPTLAWKMLQGLARQVAASDNSR
jgi:CRP-like cAMP-binding protein